MEGDDDKERTSLMEGNDDEEEEGVFLEAVLFGPGRFLLEDAAIGTSSSSLSEIS